jgi:hypothetical protein
MPDRDDSLQHSESLIDRMDFWQLCESADCDHGPAMRARWIVLFDCHHSEFWCAERFVEYAKPEKLLTSRIGCNCMQCVATVKVVRWRPLAKYGYEK